MAVRTGVLTTAVDAVVRQDLAALSTADLQEQVAAVATQAQRLSAFAALAMARLDVRTGGRLPTDDGGSRSVAGWAAEATRDSASATGRLIRTAAALEIGLPLVAQAVLDGVIGFAHATVLTRLVGAVDSDALLESQESLVLAATVMDPVSLAAHVRHLIATWVEPVLDADERSGSARRYLTTRRTGDGSVWGSFRLAGGDAELLLTAIEPLARRQGLDDTRSAAQRRADALVDVCDQVLRHGDLPDAGGQRAQLSYVLPADWAARRTAEQSCPDCHRCEQHWPLTFAGLVRAGLPAHEDASCTGPSSRAAVPAEHACATGAWTGPQTRARIETLLCDARLTRVLLDSAGQVTGLESLSDEVTLAQRRALAARDLGCAARGCSRPPACCDAHHLVGRAHDGPATLGNLVLLCRRHHVLWHLGKVTLRDLHVPWLIEALPPGGPPAPAAGPPPASPREPADPTGWALAF